VVLRTYTGQYGITINSDTNTIQLGTDFNTINDTRYTQTTDTNNWINQQTYGSTDFNTEYKGGSDNLGSHLATQDLNLASYDLNEVNNVVVRGDLNIYGGNINFGDATTMGDGGDAIGFNIRDNTATSFIIEEQNSRDYILIQTSNGTENISFGNTTTNPSYAFLGTGTATFSGNITTTGDLTVNGGNINFGITTDIGDGGDDLYIKLKNKSATAFTIEDSTTDYIAINTGTGTQAVNFGNTSTNPSYAFLGSGTATFSGNLTTTLDLAVNGGNINFGTDTTIGDSGDNLTVKLKDNSANAFIMNEAESDYIKVSTQNGIEYVGFGNQTTDNDFFFLSEGDLNLNQGKVSHHPTSADDRSIYWASAIDIETYGDSNAYRGGGIYVATNRTGASRYFLVPIPAQKLYGGMFTIRQITARIDMLNNADCIGQTLISCTNSSGTQYFPVNDGSDYGCDTTGTQDYILWPDTNASVTLNGDDPCMILFAVNNSVVYGIKVFGVKIEYERT
ncbi:MAG: hypothetical protein ABIA76_01625, partial [Candidatus Diapherotrites archaeon]